MFNIDGRFNQLWRSLQGDTWAFQTPKMLALCIMGRRRKRIGVPGSDTVGKIIEFDTEIEWIDSDLRLGEEIQRAARQKDSSCLCTGGQPAMTAHTNAHMRKFNYFRCGRCAVPLGFVTAKQFLVGSQTCALLRLLRLPPTQDCLSEMKSYYKRCRLGSWFLIRWYLLVLADLIKGI